VLRCHMQLLNRLGGPRNVLVDGVRGVQIQVKDQTHEIDMIRCRKVVDNLVGSQPEENTHMVVGTAVLIAR